MSCSSCQKKNDAARQKRKEIQRQATLKRREAAKTQTLPGRKPR